MRTAWIIVLAAIVAAEIAARAILWSPMVQMDIGTPRKYFSVEAIGDWGADQDNIWIDHRTLPFYVHINAQGFRTIEDMDRRKFQILALGDSYTFGLFVSSHDIWTRVAEQILIKEKRYALQIQNADLPGTTIIDHLAYLNEKGSRAKPNLVLLGVHENDLGDLRIEGTQILPTREDFRRMAEDGEQRFYGLRGFLGRHLALYSAARAVKDSFLRRAATAEVRRIQQAFAPTPAPSEDETPQPSDPKYQALSKRYEQLFKSAVETARGLDAKVAVIYLPGVSPRSRAARPLIEILIERLALDLGLPLLNLTEEMARHDYRTVTLLSPVAGQERYYNDSHLSRFGHIIAGRAIARFLDEELGVAFPRLAGGS